MTDFYALTPDEQATHLEGLANNALPLWGLAGAKLELIKHRENAVFRVSHDSQQYALRIHRAGYHSDAELLSELEWIAALNSKALRTPQVIPASDGARFAHISHPEVPEPRQVDLLEWFAGTPLASVEDGNLSEAVSSLHAVGRLMAITHDHSSGWTIPADFQRHAWDEDGLLGPEPFWGRYWELDTLTDDDRELLAAARAKALGELENFGKTSDRYGLIHADCVPENLLRDGDTVCLIDFDDAGFGWHVFDIATTLFFHLGEPHYDEAEAALLAGYREVRELPEDHLAHLPLFFLLRGLTYLGWVHTRSETETARTMKSSITEAVTTLAREYLQ